MEKLSFEQKYGPWAALSAAAIASVVGLNQYADYSKWQDIQRKVSLETLLKVRESSHESPPVVWTRKSPELWRPDSTEIVLFQKNNEGGVKVTIQRLTPTENGKNESKILNEKNLSKEDFENLIKLKKEQIEWKKNKEEQLRKEIERSEKERKRLSSNHLIMKPAQEGEQTSFRDKRSQQSLVAKARVGNNRVRG